MRKNSVTLVAVLLLVVTTVAFTFYRMGTGAVWNDTPQLVCYAYDRDSNVTAAWDTLLHQTFSKFTACGYRPLAEIINTIGIHRFHESSAIPIGWLISVGAIHGAMSACLFLVAHRYTEDTIFALFAVTLTMFSPAVVSASWVLFSGIQAITSLVICLGLLLYYRTVEASTGRPFYLIALTVVMLIGPWYREFCGLLAVLVVLLEIRRVGRPTWLMCIAGVLFLHAVFPMAGVRWLWFPEVPLVSVFGVGSLGNQVSLAAFSELDLLPRLAESIRWLAPWNLVVQVPPLLLLMTGGALIMQVLQDVHNRKARLWLLTVVGYIVVMGAILLNYAGDPSLRSGGVVGLWCGIGIALLAARWDAILAVWFLLSFLPFLKVYTEHIHFAYAMVPASIVFALAAKSLWSKLSGQAKWRRQGRIVFIAVLSIVCLDQLAVPYGSRLVNEATYSGIRRVADRLRSMIPEGAIVVANVLHGEDIRLYSSNHFRLYWSVGAGTGDKKRVVMNPCKLLELYQRSPDTPIFLLDVHHDRLPYKQAYHSHKYVYALPLPKYDLGQVHETRVKYPIVDPLRLFIPRHYVSFLGAPDLVDDFYTGPARSGSAMLRETHAVYRLYRLSSDSDAFRDALKCFRGQ